MMLKGYVFQLRDMLMPYKRMRPMIKYIQGHNNTGGLVGVEIGVQNGAHSKSILENLPIEKLYLVDPFKSYDKYGTEDGSDSWAQSYSQSDFDLMFEGAKFFLRRYSNVSFVRMMSSEAVGVVPDGLDFVYIDGNHSYNFVKGDIELWFPKIKAGGFLGGHDYDYTQSSIVRAVDDWIDENDGLDLKFYGNDWWVNK